MVAPEPAYSFLLGQRVLFADLIKINPIAA
jgi:hypothetical protein